MSKSNRTPAGEKGTADRVEADDGGFWVRLVTKQALDREGSCMEHCIGFGSYDYLVGDEDLTEDAVWSLRDASGLSRLTAKVVDQDIKAAYGPNNHDIGKWEALQVKHLVAAFRDAGKDLTSHGYKDVVITKDGRTFRHDRVPKDVREAMEAAELERRAAADARRQSGPGPGGGGAQFRPLDYFTVPARIELISSERRDRPVIDRLRVSDNPAHAAFLIAQELTRGEQDPVRLVTFTQDPDRGAPHFRFGLQSGREVRVSGRALMHASIHGLSIEAAFREAFLEAYRDAVGQAPAPEPEAAFLDEALDDAPFNPLCDRLIVPEAPQAEARTLRGCTLDWARRLPVGTCLFDHEISYQGPWSQFRPYTPGMIVAAAGLPYINLHEVRMGQARPQDEDAVEWRLLEGDFIEQALRGHLLACEVLVRPDPSQTIGEVYDRLARDSWATLTSPDPGVLPWSLEPVPSRLIPLDLDVEVVPCSVTVTFENGAYRSGPPTHG